MDLCFVGHNFLSSFAFIHSMKDMRILTVFFLILTLSQSASAQNGRSAAARSELGVMAGGMYYIGDLNQFRHYLNTYLSGGILFRYEINPRWMWRTNALYGKVSSDDADSRLELNQQRNLNFNSTIWEAATGVELHYFPFRIGDDRFRATGYIFAQLGAFRMNPKTDYNGDQVELRPLGTEGQGTSLNSKSRYNAIQITMPLGVGGKFSFGERTCLGIEFGLRKTFTDYLDDVGASGYADYDQLLAESGPLVAELSNRSGDRFGKRGNSTTTDWYIFSGITLTFRLGDPSTCWRGH